LNMYVFMKMYYIEKKLLFNELNYLILDIVFSI
jgi:hypothetical protein